MPSGNDDTVLSRYKAAHDTPSTALQPSDVHNMKIIIHVTPQTNLFLLSSTPLSFSPFLSCHIHVHTRVEL